MLSRGARKGQPRTELEPRPSPGRERADDADAAAADEERLTPARLGRGSDQAELEPAQPLEALQALDHVLERLDAIAEPRRLFVPELVGQTRQPSPQARQRATLEERIQLLGRGGGEGARGEGGSPAAGDRAEAARGLADDEVLAAAAQVDAVFLATAAGVRRRRELADQAELLERGLELGSEHAPLDPLQGEQGRLDRRPLALAAEVGAQSRAEVPGPADVQHLVVAVAEEVDARTGRGSMRKGALPVDAALARRGKRPELGEASGAELLGEADQVDEDLGRRLGVRERAVTRGGRDAEEVRERRQADTPHPTLEQAACKGGRAERRLGQAASVPPEELLFEEAPVEAGVVRDEQLVAGECKEAAKDAGERRRASQLLLSEPGDTRNVLGQLHAGIDERLERVDGLERPHANRPELADPVARRRETGCLEVEDDELGVLQQGVGAHAGQRHRGTCADDATVAEGDLGEERAREPVRDRRGRKESARGVDGRHGAALFEQIHQPIERIKRELHPKDESEHVFAWQGRAPLAGRFLASPRGCRAGSAARRT